MVSPVMGVYRLGMGPVSFVTIYGGLLLMKSYEMSDCSFRFQSFGWYNHVKA